MKTWTTPMVSLLLEGCRHPCAGHATEVQPPKQLACPFCAFSTPLPALQKHIVSQFDNPAQVSQLQAQPRQRHKNTPVITLSSFWGSQTGQSPVSAAVQSDISNCAAWWKLSPEEEAAEIADLYCHLHWCRQMFHSAQPGGT